MKTTNLFFKALLLFLIYTSSILAQKSTVMIGGKQIFISDNSFPYKDTTEKIFLKTNAVELWNIRTEISQLNFDHCNHNILEFLIYSDSTETNSSIELITGTSLAKIDTAIISIIKTHSNKLKSVNFKGSLVRCLIFVKFQFHNKATEEHLQHTYSSYTLDETFSIINYNLVSLNKGARNVVNECEDDLFFYDEGVKCFQNGNFGKAIYNFTQAINSNPNDMDATYNLGLSYENSDKLKKACQCFSNGMEKGDTSSVKAFNKFCTGGNSK